MDEYVDKVRQRPDRFPDSAPALEPVLAAADWRQRFPWARTVVIRARRYDHYNLPPLLQGRFSRYYLFDARFNPAARDYRDGLAFSSGS